MSEEIQMIHGYSDATDENDLNENSVLLDSDVGVGKYPSTTWTSKKLDVNVLREWLLNTLTFCSGNYVSLANQNTVTNNVETNVRFATTVTNNGVICSGQTDFTVGVAGDYRIDVQLQVVRTSGGSNQHVDVWLEYNGAKVENSNRHLTVVSNSGHVILPLSHLLRLHNNTDVLRIKWAVSSVEISLISDAATSLHPANPSASILITKI